MSVDGTRHPYRRGSGGHGGVRLERRTHTDDLRLPSLLDDAHLDAPGRMARASVSGADSRAGRDREATQTVVVRGPRSSENAGITRHQVWQLHLRAAVAAPNALPGDRVARPGRIELPTPRSGDKAASRPDRGRLRLHWALRSAPQPTAAPMCRRCRPPLQAVARRGAPHTSPLPHALRVQSGTIGARVAR